MKKVQILIKSSCSTGGDKPEESQLFTVGELKKAKDRFIIKYFEDPAQDKKSDKFSELIIWSENTVILKSNGTFKYTFRLAQGRKTRSDFFAEGFFANLAIDTLKVSHSIKEDGGEISLNYLVDTSGNEDSSQIMEKNVTVSVKPI